MKLARIKDTKEIVCIGYKIHGEGYLSQDMRRLYHPGDIDFFIHENINVHLKAKVIKTGKIVNVYLNVDSNTYVNVATDETYLPKELLIGKCNQLHNVHVNQTKEPVKVYRYDVGKYISLPTQTKPIRLFFNR